MESDQSPTKNKTQVLLFTPKYPPYQGGAATYYSNLIEEQPDDIEYIVITSYSTSKSIFEREDNIIIRIIPFLQLLPIPLRLILEGTTAFFTSIVAMILWKPNITHIHSTAIGTPFVGIASSILQVPIIYDCRDNDFYSWIIKIGPVAYWGSCATSITNRLVEDGIPRDLIIQSQVENPNYVTEIDKVTTYPDDDKFRLIFVGSVRKEKGVHLIIKSFNKLDLENVELHIVGDGEDKKSLQAMAGPKVTFTGPLPHKDTLKKIKHSDVLLLPSESEGRPRVILEAFELGTPVIATPVGDISDMIEDNETGILVSQSTDDIMEGILRLYKNKKLWKRISKQGKEKITSSSGFSEPIVNKYRDFQ